MTSFTSPELLPSLTGMHALCRPSVVGQTPRALADLEEKSLPEQYYPVLFEEYALAEGSGELESFSAELGGGLEYPHYTRPAEFRGWRVPGVLLSGDHAKIESWRREQVR